MTNLSARIIKSYAWVGSTRVITKIFSFTATVILARLLMPEDFGLMGMAMVFIGLADYLNELGISAAIIQADDISDRDLFSLLCLMIGINGCLFLAAAGAAPYIASLYGRPELTPIIVTLSAAFILSGFRTVPHAVLTKELKFDKISKATAAGGMAALLAGTIFALTGFRVWALVAAFLFNHALISTIVWFYRPIRFLGLPDFSCVRRYVKFGVPVTGSRILWYVYTQSDRLLIGKFIGAGALGIYEMALSLVGVAVNNVTAIANTVSYPAYTKLQNNLEGLRDHFLTVTKYVAMLSFPAIAGLIVVREDFVLVVLSWKWEPILFVLPILGVTAMIRSIGALIGPVLNAIGRPDLPFKLNLVNVLLFPVSFLGAIEWGIVGVAVAWLILSPIMYGAFLILNFARIGLTVGAYAKSLTQPVIVTVSMVVMMVGARSFLPEPGMIRFSATVVTGLLWCIGYLSFWEKETVMSLRGTARAERIR